MQDIFDTVVKHSEVGIVGLLSGFTIFLFFKNKLSKDGLEQTKNDKEKSLIELLSTELKDRKIDVEKAREAANIASANANNAAEEKIAAHLQLAAAEDAVSYLREEVKILHKIVGDLDVALSESVALVDEMKNSNILKEAAIAAAAIPPRSVFD